MNENLQNEIFIYMKQHMDNVSLGHIAQAFNKYPFSETDVTFLDDGEKAKITFVITRKGSK